MASSSSSHSQEGKNRGFSGIEPPGIRRKASESTTLYDVFINHRGPDTKKVLARPLYDLLEKIEIRAFLDEEEMELGLSCTSTIETAISSAAVHIAIFSETYAQSSWCLEELVLMLRSRAKIIPVFYKVEPSAVRYIKGAYADAFIEYQNKSRYLEKLEEWMKALQSISFTAGHVIKDLNASDCEKIVSAVQKEVQKTKPLLVAKHPVALDKLARDFERRCLDKLVQDFEIQCGMNEGEGKAKIVGVFGMGGVGKTTLCKELFNRKRQQYNRACFLFDCREASAQSKLPSLQMKILRDLFGEKDLSFLSTEEGLSSICNCIERSSSFSFLLIIDDIDHREQLDALLPIKDMPGNSLVIITTRDEGILIAERVGVRYHLKQMDKEDAEQLFSLHAFSHPHPASGYEDLVDGFLGVCGGLPLSLQVLGRHVSGRDKHYWGGELKKLCDGKLHQDIKKKLQISFDDLETEEKQIFIDIACFFVDQLKSIAIRGWEASGWSAQNGLQRLKDKCLVEEIEDPVPVLRMHDHLRDMGREMAGESRLWRPRDLKHLESEGFENILTQIKRRCFHSFFDESLKSTITFLLGESDDSSATSTSLLLLHLDVDVDGYSCDSIPSWVPLQNIQCFRIYNGDFKRLWRRDVQAPSRLRELEIFGTVLEEFPDCLGILTNVEKGVIEGPPLLRSFPTNLHVLDSNDGRKSATVKAPLSFLEDLVISKQKNIIKIVISGNHCPKLQSLELSSMKNLIEVKFSNCEDLKRLNCLEVSKCRVLKRLSVTSDLTKLEELNISECYKLEEANLGRLGYLKRITIADCNLKSVPGISDFRMLVELNISRCPMLLGLSLARLGCLEKVMIENCSNLKCVTGIPDLPKLVELSISSCWKLQLELRLVGLTFLKRITVDWSLKVNCFDLDGCKSLETVSAANIDFQKIRMVNISDCPELREFPFPVICDASCLERITISGCMKLNYLQLTGCRILKRLSGNFDLDKLSIEHCPMLEELPCFGHVTCLEQIHILRCGILQNITLPMTLKRLELDACGELKSVSGISALKKLVELNIHACPKLHELGVAHLSCLEKFVIANVKKVSGISNLTKLVELKISECWELELEMCLSGLSCLKNITIIDSGKMHTITLPTSLIKLKLNACRELEKVAGISGLTELVELSIKNSPKLQGDLHLSGLNCLYSISVVENWNMHNMILPVTLRELKVQKCRKLQKIAGMEGLTELTELYISECPELEEIPSLARASHFERIKIDSCDKVQNITLPTKLFKLTVQSCRHLQRIAGMDDLAELTELYVSKCSELEELPSLAGVSRMSITIDSCDKLQNITLSTKLIKLTLKSCRHLRRIAGMDDLTELTELYISECSELEELPSLAGVSGMKSINIDSCDKLQNITLSTKLIKLTLQSCRHLQRIAGMDDLTELTELYISECSELEELPSLAGVSRMESINIDSCDKLHNITLSTTLNKLIVERCRGLQRIAGMSNLKDVTELCIRDCPKLEQLPFICDSSSLERITIDGCRKLNRLQVSGCGILNGVWGNFDLAQLSVWDCPEVEELPCFAHLTCLEEISIFRCGKLQEITLPTTLKLLHLDACTELKKVSEISHLNNLVQLIISQCAKLQEITLPRSLKLLHLDACTELKQVSGIYHLNNLVQLIISQCWQLELPLSLGSMNSLENITFDECGKRKYFLLNKCQNLKRVSVSFDVEDLSIFDCAELEELSVRDCSGRLYIRSCDKLENITLPTTLIKLSVHRCRGLQMVAGIGNLTKLTDMSISECPELEELPSLARLSYLKRISIDSCEKLETIAGIEELQALKTLELSFCSNATIQNCIGKLKRVPSAFIQVIGKAAEGAKSNLNPSLLSEAIFCEDEATLYRTLDDLEGSVSAIIVCGVVDGSSSALLPFSAPLRSSALLPFSAPLRIPSSDLLSTINKQFNLRQGEWIITAVITDINTVTHYFWQFDYLIKGGKMKGCRWAVMEGEDGGTLHALTTIIDKLHQK